MDALTPFHARPASGSELLIVLAKILRILPHAEFMELCRDLHSDSEILGKSPYEVAELLERWVSRQLEPNPERTLL